MKLEQNVKPDNRPRGFWDEKAKLMKVNSSYFPLTQSEYLALLRAMKKLGFEGRREKKGDNMFRVWREK